MGSTSGSRARGAAVRRPCPPGRRRPGPAGGSAATPPVPGWDPLPGPTSVGPATAMPAYLASSGGASGGGAGGSNSCAFTSSSNGVTMPAGQVIRNDDSEHVK